MTKELPAYIINLPVKAMMNVSAEQNFAEYRTNWLEEEAFLTAPFAKEIFSYITPIFR